MRTSWSPLAWSKVAAKDQDVIKPRAIPEDCISLGGYEHDMLVCATSRTDNTDGDACSPYNAKLHRSCINESWSEVPLLSSRTDDTDDGSPRKARRVLRCSTLDLVDIVDKRTAQVEQLLQVGNQLVTKGPEFQESSPCFHNNRVVSDSPAHKDTLHGCEWENLHDEANAQLEDIRCRLATLADDSTCTSENTSIDLQEVLENETKLAEEMKDLQELANSLSKELGEVRQGEAELREEVCMLRERLSRVDRQAATTASEFAEFRKAKVGSELQEVHSAAPVALQPPTTRERPRVPKLRLQSVIGNANATKPKALPPNFRSNVHLKRTSPNTQLPSRPFMGQNFFRK